MIAFMLGLFIGTAVGITVAALMQANGGDEVSVSKWRWQEDCDGYPCPGDCDHCGKEDEDDEREVTS